MAPRMLCTDCEVTARPDTRLPGSDLVEMLGWLCFALPGWLYCAWRHALRIKVCPRCGGRELVRQARAQAEREGVPAPDPVAAPRIENLHGPVRWPVAWRAPRDRLRRGAVLVLLPWAWLVLQQHGTAPAGLATTSLAVLWSLRELRRFSRTRAGCRAWDDRGRPLPIEFAGSG